MNRDHLGFIGREYSPLYDKQNKRLKWGLSIRDPLLIDYSLKQHTLIIAKSGSGKSYLARVICEELIRSMENYAILIIDPMGIFSTLSRKGNELDIRGWNSEVGSNEVTAEGLPNVETWIPRAEESKFDADMYDRVFSLRANQITYPILCYCFDMDVLDPQINLFRKCQNRLAHERSNYSLGDLKTYILENHEEMHFKSATNEALQSRLDALEELGLVDSDGINISEMIREKHVAIMDLSMSSIYTAKIIVSFLADQALTQRKIITRKVQKAKENSTMVSIPNYIPPIQLVVDEAHNFFPRNEILQKFIKEGRNVGCMLTAISQSPDLTKPVYANIIHLFVGQLNFDEDILAIKGMLPIEKTPKDLRKEIKSLDVGCFYYYNIDKKLEKRIRVRPSRTIHPASTELNDERQYLLHQFVPVLPLKPDPVDLMGEVLDHLRREQRFLDILSEDYPEYVPIIEHLVKTNKIKILGDQSIELC
jgi:hypothetical protein